MSPGDTDELVREAVLQLVAQAPDAVVIVDAQGMILYWNRGAERIFGHRAADVTGTTLDVIIPDRLRQRHWDGFRSAMARGTTRYADDDLLAVPAVTADGRTISIEFTVVLLQDTLSHGTNGPVGYVGAIIREVTARRAREQDMRRRLDALEATPPPT